MNYITVFIEGLGRLPEKLFLAFVFILKAHYGTGEENRDQFMYVENALDIVLIISWG